MERQDVVNHKDLNMKHKVHKPLIQLLDPLFLSVHVYKKELILGYYLLFGL